MRRITAVFLFAVLLLSTAGCKKKSNIIKDTDDIGREYAYSVKIKSSVYMKLFVNIDDNIVNAYPLNNKTLEEFDGVLLENTTFDQAVMRVVQVAIDNGHIVKNSNINVDVDCIKTPFIDPKSIINNAKGAIKTVLKGNDIKAKIKTKVTADLSNSQAVSDSNVLSDDTSSSTSSSTSSQTSSVITSSAASKTSTAQISSTESKAENKVNISGNYSAKKVSGNTMTQYSMTVSESAVSYSVTNYVNVQELINRGEVSSAEEAYSDGRYGDWIDYKGNKYTKDGSSSGKSASVSELSSNAIICNSGKINLRVSSNLASITILGQTSKILDGSFVGLTLTK